MNIIKRILSDDYSAYGTFAMRVFIITIITTFTSIITFIMTHDFILVTFQFVCATIFFIWGMRKQGKEIDKIYGHYTY